MQNVKAKLLLVLSGYGRLRTETDCGLIQAIVDRMVALAPYFDSTGQIEVWAYASKCKKLESLSSSNSAGFIDRHKHQARGFFAFFDMDVLENDIGSDNAAIPAVRAILSEHANPADKTPHFVAFINNGSICEEDKCFDTFNNARSQPIFFQVVGLGKGGNTATGALFSAIASQGKLVTQMMQSADEEAKKAYLQKKPEVWHNASMEWFDEILNETCQSDLSKINDQDFFDTLLKNFPEWLAEARAAGIIE